MATDKMFQKERLDIPKIVQHHAWRRMKKRMEEARKYHGDGQLVSAPELMGAITEEYLEVIEAIRSAKSQDMISELLDLAVVSLWGAASMINWTVPVIGGGKCERCGRNRPKVIEAHFHREDEWFCPGCMQSFEVPNDPR